MTEKFQVQFLEEAVELIDRIYNGLRLSRNL